MRRSEHAIVHSLVDLDVIKELLLLLLPLQSREHTCLLGAYVVLRLVQHLIRSHVGVEDVSNGKAATVVFHLYRIALHYVVFFSHAAVLILVGHDLILYLTKLLIKVVNLVAHALDVLHNIVGLLFLLRVLLLGIDKLFALVLFFLTRFLEFVGVPLDEVFEFFDVPLELDDLAVPLLADLVQVRYYLLVPLFLVYELVKVLHRVGVAKAQLDLVLVKRISVEELLITLNANGTSSRLVGIVLWIRSCLVLALATVTMGAKLAVLDLLRRGDDCAAGIAHDASLECNLLPSVFLLLLLSRHVGRLITKHVNRISGIEKTAKLSVGSQNDLRDLSVHLLVLFLRQLHILVGGVLYLLEALLLSLEQVASALNDLVSLIVLGISFLVRHSCSSGRGVLQA